jgi:hypothetical protein
MYIWLLQRLPHKGAAPDIKTKCSQHLDVHIHKLRNPSLIIYNIPEEITKENAEEIIATQNPELNLCEGDVKPKFITKGRRNTRNLVVEVGPLVRRQIFKTKLKIGWHICNAEDYVVVNRCYNCSGYNHKANFCRGVESCPLCAGGHKLKDCTASVDDYNCVNCAKFNKYNNNAQVSVKHSSLDQSCPSLQAMVRKYKQNTEY